MEYRVRADRRLYSGTTLTLLGTAMFTQYISYTGGKYDPYVGLYTINATQYDELQILVFNIGGVSDL